MVSLGTQPANRKSGFGHSSPTGARAQDLSRQGPPGRATMRAPWPRSGAWPRLQMMQSHFFSMLLFAGFVSLIFAVLMKDELADQVRLGGILFASFVATAVVLGWIMFPFPL